MVNLVEINQRLANQSPLAMIEWAINYAKNQLGKSIISFHFGLYEVVLLHLFTQVKLNLLNELNYVDPTKGFQGRECGKYKPKF